MDDRYAGPLALDLATWESNRRLNDAAGLIHPVVVGQVFANPVVPNATSKYFSVHPVSLSGIEGEGKTGTLTVDATRSFLVYVVGTKSPVVGEYLICRFIGNRWVAERMGKSSSVVTLPGCPCIIPSTLHMSVIQPDANFGMFQDATLSYITVPPELALLSLGTKSYISTTTFIDEITQDRFWYRFFCSGGYFCISRIYATSVYGSPYSDSIRYRWLGGQPGNSCIPFLMTNGKVFPGGDPASVVTLSE